MTRIERYDLDATGKQCCEGFYAYDAKRNRLVLAPPTAELAAHLRLATADEVARGGAVQANVEDLTNCDPTPSDRGA